MYSLSYNFFFCLCVCVQLSVLHCISIMRMAESSARMNLRDHVRDDDVDFGIKVRH